MDDTTPIRDDNLRLILSKGHEEWLAQRRASIRRALREDTIGAGLCVAWLAATPLFIAFNRALAGNAAVPEVVTVGIGVVIGLLTLCAPFVLLVAGVDYLMNSRRLSDADREAADHQAFLERYKRS